MKYTSAEILTANRASGAAAGFIAGSLVFCVLAVIVRFSVTVPAIDADRGATFSKALFEIRTNEDAFLTSPGWVDRNRGIVRLPIETAMQLMQSSWRNPASGRDELLLRSQKASAPAPKTAPAPSQFK